MEIVEDVVIVGGGIAGLSTALALMRVGVQSLVLERSDMLRTTGAALTLGPNAWVALDALGVADQLTSIYTSFQKQYITNVANGAVQEVLFSGSDTSNIAVRTVHRSTLLETLARELPANTIRFSAKMKSIQILQHGGSSITVLSLEDGTIIKAKVVIGCDGVNSVVAQWLGLATPIRSSRSAVRGLAVFPQGHGLQHEIHQFLDKDNKAGFVPLNDKELYWFINYESRLNEDDYMKTKDPESMQKNILESMAHFPKVYLDVVRHADLNTVSWAPFVFRAPWDLLYKSLSKGNVTVAGDAMHPTMPDLGQGGSTTLEDAVVLGRHIGNSLIQNGKIVPEAVEGYVKERRWRVAGVIAASFLSGWVQQERSSWFIKFLRDKVFYKYFYKYVANIVKYDCGKLPVVSMSTEAENMKKSN
ncbi:hypothetical protein ACHQM5_022205 [Ranunculus cassubicifolius]